MERLRKQEKQKAGGMSPVQLAMVVGNQAVVQMAMSPRRPGFSYKDMDDCKDDRKKDSTYGVKKQYLDPSALRTALGGGTGGEAHHIIPSCVADHYSLSQDTCNQGWNGILLPGTNKGTNQNLLPNSGTLPFHRKDENRDHPKYSKGVQEKLKAAPSIGAAQTLAGSLKTSIGGLGAGNFIEDMQI